MGNLGQIILQSAPASIQPELKPYIPQIVSGLHNAMSLALGDVFWVALVTAVLGFIATLFVRELPLRGSGRTAAPVGVAEGEGEAQGEAAGITAAV